MIKQAFYLMRQNGARPTIAIVRLRYHLRSKFRQLTRHHRYAFDLSSVSSHSMTSGDYASALQLDFVLLHDRPESHQPGPKVRKETRRDLL